MPHAYSETQLLHHNREKGCLKLPNELTFDICHPMPGVEDFLWTFLIVQIRLIVLSEGNPDVAIADQL